MPQASPQVINPSTPDENVVFAPGEKFFIRRIPLAADSDPAAQVELALEGSSPFPATQLYYGFRTNVARTEALIFAAYRKNFTPEEITSWIGAAAVLPSFAGWLTVGSVPEEGISVRQNAGRLEAIAWDGQSELPAAVMVRSEEAGSSEALVAELRAKANLSAHAPVKAVRSSVEIAREKNDLIVRLGAAGSEAHFDETNLGQADIRDKELLQERRQTLRRNTLLWRGFVIILGGLAACVVLELGMLATRFWLTGRQAALSAQAPAVKRIEQAQSMAKRLEEISTQRLLPFEMLNAVNEKRPRSVEFTTVTTKGNWQLDIRAEASNADDATNFASDLRKVPGIERVDVGDMRTREGVTVFTLGVTFKPGWAQTGGGS